MTFFSNDRGGWLIIAQFTLFALILFGPAHTTSLPGWNQGRCDAGSFAGLLLIITGGALALAATWRQGRNFTPFICPKAGSILLEQGPYRLVRHPIYSGLLLMGFGWGLWRHSWLILGYALMLFILLDLKARREERWLKRYFPGYDRYRRRVSRFIPYLY